VIVDVAALVPRVTLGTIRRGCTGAKRHSKGDTDDTLVVGMG
jgi:hypothetical protein